MSKRTIDAAGRLARSIILIFLIVCVFGATFAANAADSNNIPTATVTGGTLKASMPSAYENGVPYGYLYIIEIPAGSASTKQIKFTIGSPGWKIEEGCELVSIIAPSGTDDYDYGNVLHNFNSNTLTFSLSIVDSL